MEWELGSMLMVVACFCYALAKSADLCSIVMLIVIQSCNPRLPYWLILEIGFPCLVEWANHKGGRFVRPIKNWGKLFFPPASLAGHSEGDQWLFSVPDSWLRDIANAFLGLQAYEEMPRMAHGSLAGKTLALPLSFDPVPSLPHSSMSNGAEGLFRIAVCA